MSNKLSFEELTKAFGKEEVASILRTVLIEEDLNYKWLRFNYDRKKDYLSYRIDDNRTPDLNTYMGLKSQLLDIEELPKLNNAVKKLNRLAFQYFQVTGGLTTRNDKLIDEMKLDHIRQTPIESLYEGHLRVNGTRLIGKCPFHDDKTPSFTVYTDKNAFHCFGCGKHGFNAIDFLMLKDGISFIDAVRRLS